MKPMYLEYPSTQDAALRLFAEFDVPDEPRPLLVQMHGWHGQVKRDLPDNVDGAPDRPWLAIRPEMRGRGDAAGRPDGNGWELQDVVDAVAFARAEFADRVADADRVALHGGSGGGGNVFALLGKFPDTFCVAQSQCGISDYALWYRGDAMGEFRDELEVWIGGDPDARPEAYASRGGLTTVGNLLTPLIIFHGETDVRVPCEQSRRFAARARTLGVRTPVVYHELAGVGTRDHFGNITDEQRAMMARAGAEFMQQPAPPVTVPERGRFIVAGYLKTKRFAVVLDSIDRVAMLDYDLAAGSFRLAAPSAKEATVRVFDADGAAREIGITPQPCALADIAPAE